MDMHPGFGGLAGHGRVQEGRGGNVYGVDWRIPQHLFIGGVDSLDPVFRRELICPSPIKIADGDDFGMGMAYVAFQVGGCHKPQPYDANVYGFHMVTVMILAVLYMSSRPGF